MRKIVLSTVALTSLVAVAACSENSDEPKADTGPVAVDSVEPAVELTFADLTGDAAAGEAVFVQCRACHSVEEGRNGVGPSLYGIIGAKAGAVDAFNYTDANANSGIIWTSEVIFEFLESPREYLPGTRMAYPGLRDAQARADLIAFLEATGQ
ncbi:c-type cytochrome [Erythrobacter sp. Alg231-14]|uniref:c-type cytochrome n=1 Tax=Erythrobacter sp. Alg231-14 TaxID=1922225 RepID=UPI00307BB19B